MNDYVNLNDTKEYLNILLKATKNLIKDFNSAHKLGTISSNLYDLELVEF